MRYIITLFLLGLTLAMTAQQAKYSRVKIKLSPEQNIEQLASLGVEADHGKYAKHRFFISEFSEQEIADIQAAGFVTEVLIDDLAAHVVAQNQSDAIATDLRSSHCGGDDGTAFDYQTPDNFQLGTMGGFYTYEEMLAELDRMLALYPHLISVRTPVDNIVTHEDRPIYWLQISDNPNEAEADEPQVLYTALHHAREPQGLSQLIFYMWYLLERYDTDPEIQYLVDNTAMYFMPCLNPDGYVFNQTTNPNGGGFWRKNRRDNGDGTMGVDLNRNYGYEWGYDNQGSSPNTDSQTYRGPSGFSEPETQAVRDFCNIHDFKIALNYHTFGNLLIYPWGFLDTPTEDAPIFNGFAEAMIRENDFLAGTGTETVGYVVNGDSDDWFYGETETKNAIFAMTPEAGPGDYGFWPPASEIEYLSKTTLLMNLTTAHLVHNFGLAKDQTGTFLENIDNQLEYSIERYGLADGDLTVSLTALTDNVISTGVPVTYTLDQNEAMNDVIGFSLSPDIANGEEVVLLLSVDNGIINTSDTLRKLFLSTEVVLGDVTDDFGANWTPSNNSNWALVTSDFYTSPSSITDSPNGDYPNGHSSSVTLNSSAPIATTTQAFLTYWAKWDIENDYDYAQIQLSVDGGDTYFPICGQYTNMGTSDQMFDEPLYDGVQSDWVKEEIDITEYFILADEPDVSVRFTLNSDNFVTGDGFYFDEVELAVAVEDTMTSSIPLVPAELIQYSIRPNPATNFALLEINAENVAMNDATVIVYNTLGQVVLQKDLENTAQQTVRLHTESWKSGVYFYQIAWQDKVVGAKKLTIF